MTDNELYKKLKREIIYHKYRYYHQNENDITDQEYDKLEQKFDALAEKLKMPGSWVGYDPARER